MDLENAFQTLKNEVISVTAPSHYDQNKTSILACDASNKVIGAVLMQDNKGVETPIAHASKTLTETQIRYSKLSEKR